MNLKKFTFLFILSCLPALTLFSQSDPWDMDLDAIIPEESLATEPEEVQRPLITGTLKVWNYTQAFLPGDTPLNPDDAFSLNEVENESVLQLYGTLFPGRMFQLNADAAGTVLYSMADSFEEIEVEYQIDLNELYLQFFPAKWGWLSIEAGRKSLSLGNSYVFNIFQPYTREEPSLKNPGGITEGCDLAALGLLGEKGDLYLFYVEDSNSLNLYGNLLLNRLVLSSYTFVDFQGNWMAGSGYSLELGNRLLAYSDLSVAELDDDRDELQYRGSLLGLSLSLDSFPDFLTELYTNSSGYSMQEWNDYNDYIDSLSSDAHLQSPMAGYYYGLLGSELAGYDPFRRAAWLLYLRCYDTIGQNDTTEWALSAFLSLQDFSALIQPSIKGEISSHWNWEIAGTLYLGNEGSTFRLLPYRGSAGLKLGYCYE